MEWRKQVGSTLQGLVAIGCCVGVWNSLDLARADYHFRKDTIAEVRDAIRFASDGWPYYMRLSQFDKEHAIPLLDRSLGLNRYNAQANIELGLRYEAEGDFIRAESQLLAAYDIDRTYLPRWSLANYYFRRDNLPEFWRWARSAAEMPSDDIGGLLELCWRTSSSADSITAALINDKPEFLRQYVRFLLSKNESHAAAEVGARLMRVGDAKSDTNSILAILDESISQGNSSDALSIWRSLSLRGWVIADPTIPNNARFSREPISSRFDWSLPEYTGLHSWPGDKGLQIEFSGAEPENCIVAEQTVVLNQGNYRLSFEFESSGIAPDTGVKWQVVDAESQRIFSESKDLSSKQMRQSELKFSISEPKILLLRLNYRRALGTVRVIGTINVKSVEVGKL